MKLVKSLILIALLSGVTLQVSASGTSSEGSQIKENTGFIFGDIIPKRPPVNDDGPGGPGR